MVVIGTQNTHFHTGHQHKTLVVSRQGSKGTGLEFPLVVFNPAILLLQFLTIGAALVIVGQACIVLIFKKAVGGSDRGTHQEL